MKTAAFLLCAALLSLSACKQQAPAPEATADAANPDAKPGLSMSVGKLVLPAVKGNPGAAYFELANRSDKDTALAAVVIDGAGKTEMHETTENGMETIASLPVKAGETVTFARGGRHVMAFDLDGKLAVGGKTEATLVFADGDKLSGDLEIEAAGGSDHAH
ncbi:MAG: copper chaperone PCu(A)C [Novosphingobium sp.]|nr:copper chaperone PCu(A)C [Novosphingobium sp.]